MISLDKVDAIALEAARRHFGPKLVRRTFSEPTAAWDGEEALHITIVIAPGAVAKFKGDSALRALVQIHDSLVKAGDERFPLLEYATEKELADADSES